MTILMEMGIKKATSKAARSQLLIDTTQVPEAHFRNWLAGNAVHRIDL